MCPEVPGVDEFEKKSVVYDKTSGVQKSRRDVEIVGGLVV